MKLTIDIDENRFPPGTSMDAVRHWVDQETRLFVSALVRRAWIEAAKQPPKEEGDHGSQERLDV